MGPEKIRLGLHCPPPSPTPTQVAKSQLGCSTEILSQLRDSLLLTILKSVVYRKKAQSCFLDLLHIIGFGRRIQKLSL